jgi:hypothetical protein
VTFESGIKVQKAAVGEHGDENTPIVGAVIDNGCSQTSYAAASMQPKRAESTHFEFVKSRKSGLSKSAFGNRLTSISP